MELSEDDLEKYGFVKVISKNGVTLTKLVDGKELVCQFNMKTITHKYGGDEIMRKRFWELVIK